MIYWTDKAPNRIPNIFCKIIIKALLKKLTTKCESSKINDVKNKIKIIGKICWLKVIIVNSISFEIKIDSVIADGPATRGIDIGKTANSSASSLSIIFEARFSFLFSLFSNTISNDMKSKNNPPTIWNELIDIPIKIKKLFPNIEKNVNTVEVIRKTKIDNFIIFENE